MEEGIENDKAVARGRAAACSGDVRPSESTRRAASIVVTHQAALHNTHRHTCTSRQYCRGLAAGQACPGGGRVTVELRDADATLRSGGGSGREGATTASVQVIGDEARSITVHLHSFPSFSLFLYSSLSNTVVAAAQRPAPAASRIPAVSGNVCRPYGTLCTAVRTVRRLADIGYTCPVGAADKHSRTWRTAAQSY
eukprot:ctg_616.g267